MWGTLSGNMKEFIQHFPPHLSSLFIYLKHFIYFDWFRSIEFRILFPNIDDDDEMISTPSVYLKPVAEPIQLSDYESIDLREAKKKKKGKKKHSSCCPMIQWIFGYIDHIFIQNSLKLVRTKSDRRLDDGPMAVCVRLQSLITALAKREVPCVKKKSEMNQIFHIFYRITIISKLETYITVYHSS